MSEYYDPDAHNGKLFRAYMAVALALAVFTATSFLVNQTVSTKFLAFVLILGVAIVKATLVGMYFMHLKYDWGKLYFMIIPAFILGAMMMCVLLPDGVLAWRYERSESPVPKAAR